MGRTGREAVYIDPEYVSELCETCSDERLEIHHEPGECPTIRDLMRPSNVTLALEEGVSGSLAGSGELRWRRRSRWSPKD